MTSDTLNRADSRRAFFAGRRVLVTGHSGFKGAWLTLWLNAMGAEVSALSLPAATSPNLSESAKLSELAAARSVDIRDAAELAAAVSAAKPEVVFHLAAAALVRESYRDPAGTFATNVMGTLNIIEACKAAGGVSALVCVTTDKVYDNKEWVWPYRENDRLGGKDPYSASKACAELVAAIYQQNILKGLRPAIATARGGNVIGGGDWAQDRIVPDIVRAVQAGSPITLRNPAAIRPWQHVLELCEGYLELGMRLALDPAPFAEAWNFGPDGGNELAVGKLCALALQHLDAADHPVQVESSPLKEAQLLRLDNSKAKARLNWQPVLSMTETAEWTAGWYRDFYRGADARALCLAQIAAFEDRIRGRAA